MKSYFPHKQAAFVTESPYCEIWCETAEEAEEAREQLVRSGQRASWRSLTGEEKQGLQEL